LNTSIGALVYYLLGQEATSLMLVGVARGIVLFLMVLGILIIFYLLLPAVFGAIATYFFLKPRGNIIVSIIVFIILVIVMVRIVLPFTVGYATCSFAGQFAYLVTTVGFSVDAIQKSLFGGGGTVTIDLGSIPNSILNRFLLGSATPILIFIVSVGFGIVTMIATFKK
jgi:hypothetical protein